jgi:drug/metabolite transporter (DMT)-like permease
MPFTAFTPLFLVPIAFLILGEFPDLKGIFGIILIILGAYGLHAGSGNLLTPFKNIFANKGSRYMLIVAILWSFTATLEKVAVLSSSAAFYGITIGILLSAAYFPYIFYFHREDVKNIPLKFKKLFIIGIITGAMVIFQFSAYEYLLASYVIAFKRAGVIVSVFLGYVLFREENIIKNMTFTTLMIIGVTLIMIP